MGIKNRLKKLEGGPAGEECSECGRVPGEIPDECEIEWIDGHEEEEPDLGPEYCPKCGEQLIIEIGWGDLPEEEDGLQRRRHEEAQRELRERKPNEF
jgi:hypothetical protein